MDALWSRSMAVDGQAAGVAVRKMAEAFLQNEEVVVVVVEGESKKKMGQKKLHSLCIVCSQRHMS